MAIVLRNEGAKINSNINVTPMVDVMLVLLIIFMVITPMLQPHGVPVDLANAINPIEMSDAGKPDAVILSVMRDGQMFLGNERVTGESLVQRILGTMATRADKTVFIRADARAKYGLIVGAVDDLRSAGVDQLGLLTEKKERGSIRP
jgi:biopolymer transport protein ExbD/biopolymer transport protein TolR